MLRVAIVALSVAIMAIIEANLRRTVTTTKKDGKATSSMPIIQETGDPINTAPRIVVQTEADTSPITTPGGPNRECHRVTAHVATPIKCGTTPGAVQAKCMPRAVAAAVAVDVADDNNPQ